MLKAMGTNVLLKLLPMIVGQLSPAIKELVENLIRQWYAKALKTDNPWDDLAAEFFATLMGIELEEAG